MPKDFQTLSAEITDPSIKKTLEKEADLRRADLAIRSLDSELDEAMAARKLLPEVLGQLKTLEAALARPQNLSATLKAPAKAKGNGSTKLPDPLEISFLAGAAELRREWGHGTIGETIDKYYPDAQRDKYARRYAKAATNLGTTTDATWGASLVRSASMKWVEELTAVSIYGAMAAAGQPIPMGDNESITAPMRGHNDAGSLAAAFTEEAATIALKQGAFASQTFFRMKAAVLSAFTNELESTAVEDLVPLIQKMILSDTALMLDGVLLDPTTAPIPKTRPASPWYGTPSQDSQGTAIDDILADIAWLIATITGAQPRNPALIMDNMRLQRLRMLRDGAGFVFRDEVERGSLFGMPLLVSATVPGDKVFIMDLDDFAHWTPPPRLDVSGTATVVLADDDGVAPTMADTNAVNAQAGSIHISDASKTTPATKVVSAFQSNATILRHIQPITWGKVRTGTAAWLSNVAW